MSEPADDFDPYDFDLDDGHQCPRCDGWREVSCHCGGDLCVCENYGEMDCPLCFGEGSVSDEVYAKYCQNEREMHEAMKKIMESTSHE